MAFETFWRGWNWFVEGLAEAWILVGERWRGRPRTVVDLGEGDGSVVGPGGASLGRLVREGNTAWLEPPVLADRLRGTAIDLRIPASWVFRRALEPVAVQSAPFLDAFVRHQIDRITPWRVDDVHYRIRQTPIVGDASRLAVEVGVVPRRLVAPSLAALTPLRPRRMRLVVGDASSFDLPLGDSGPARLATLKGRLAAAVLLTAAMLILAIGWSWWTTGDVLAEIEAQDDIMVQRKAVATAAARRDRAGTEAEAALRALRAARPRAVDVIEALTAALPDSAYITDIAIGADGIRISGISRAMPDLVPALERSGKFSGVASFAATTKVEGGAGDVFHLEMKPVTLEAPAETAAPTPPVGALP